MSELSNARTVHSADYSMLGYLHQCRVALLEGLKRLYDNPSLEIAIETLDDIVFQNDGVPTELLQIKHHITHNGDLTDASPDLWKTIRIWAELFQNRAIRIDTVLLLMTTSAAPDNSIASKLKVTKRNENAAFQQLSDIARTSQNQSNKVAYSAFLKLPEEDAKKLLAQICIIDGCPQSESIENELAAELKNSCDRKDIPTFVTYLEAWWFGVIVKRFSQEKAPPIQGCEIESEMSRLRNQFKIDSLPIHPDISAATPDLSPFSKWPFIKQLRLIEISEKRIQNATLYFYKASTQRSQWIRDQLLLNEDLALYDVKLKEEWQNRFDQMTDDIPEDEEEQVKEGKNFYSWFEVDSNIPIRPACTELFITRGSYHLLANQMCIGWHPHFFEKISQQEDDHDK